MKLMSGQNLLFCFLFCAFKAEAQSLESYFRERPRTAKASVYTKTNFFVGHSLSQTTYTLPKGKWMLGTFALGYGISDDLMLGISPWLLTLYNMPNIVLRAKKSLSTSTAVGAHFGYMKTQEYLQNLYKMETFYGNLIYSHVFSRSLRTHIQLNAMFFKDDERPFSLRVARPTKALQISLSSVNEVTVYKKRELEFGVDLEVGMLGVNEKLPYYHGGFSVYRKSKNLFVQVGLSLSATTNIQTADFRYIGRGNLPPGEEDFREIVTHPEIQVQYYF